MVFKHFRFQIILRVILINLNALALVGLALNTTYYITSLSLGGLLIVQVGLLIQYAERTNTMFSRFLNAIRYDDFSQTYQIKGLGKSFNELNREFNQVMAKFQEIRADKEAQYHYLSSIVQHIAIGLIVLDKEGKVELMNRSALQILQIDRLKNLEQLDESFQPLVEYLNQPKQNKRQLIKLNQVDRMLHLALRSTAINLRGQTFRIVSLQDIQSELDDKEMEAWQNLIRVLTHEIINSVTPIASLAATVNEDLNYQFEHPEENLEVEDVHYAIKTIQKRSEGLIRFVKDFRSLTKMPMPQMETIGIKELMESIVFLEKEEFRKNQVKFRMSVQPEDLELIADTRLLEQVLINLLKNAIEALDEQSNKVLSFRAFRSSMGRTVLEIEDNGKGISPEALKNIFIPFFTTKKRGSGIGLSFSRQVLRQHGANISVQSELGKGTTFTLVFP